MPRIADIHVTEVDGVRTVWTKADRPFTAQLMFRVGFFDETLPTHGISHLVEHLALAPLKDTELDFNGHVEGHRTTVPASGHPDKVAAFMTEVCRNLSDLPTDRLLVESAILAREAEGRANSVALRLVSAYYGSRGPGLANLPEFGLSGLEAGQVRAWAERYFTKRNAVLALSGPPPESWSLPLPDGDSPRPIQLPERTVPVPDSPARLGTQKAGVSWGVLARVPRTSSQPEILTSVFVLTKRLEDRLRHDLGRVYGVGYTYWRLDRDHVFTHIGVDSNDDHSREVANEFHEVASEFVEHGPTAAEIEREARTAERRFEDYPDLAARALATYHAEALLCDWAPPPTPTETVELIRSQTPAAIRERFAEAYRQSYYVADLRGGTLSLPPEPPFGTPGDGTNFGLRLGYARRTTPHPNPIRIGPEGIYAREAEGWMAWRVDDLDGVLIEGSKVIVFEPRKMLEFDLTDYRRSTAMEQLLRRVIPDYLMIPSTPDPE